MSDRSSMSRRDFTSIAAGALAVPSLMRDAFAAPAPVEPPARWPGYGNAVVLDFLASPGPFNTPVKIDALTPEMVANARNSGITAVNLTVGGKDPEEVFRDIARWERDLDAHPDVLMKIKTVADLKTAKAQKKFGIIYGFQDTEIGRAHV